MQSLTELNKLPAPAAPGPAEIGFDPHATLQLAPGAPHSLVERVYWLLARKSREGQAAPSLDSLNRAYAMLSEPVVHDHSRAAPAYLPTVRPRASLLGRLFHDRPPASAPSGDLYAALYIHPDACPDVIELAYATLSGATGETATGRSRIEQSYAVLGNPPRRAAYHASLRDERRPPGAAAPSTLPGSAAVPVGEPGRTSPAVLGMDAAGDGAATPPAEEEVRNEDHGATRVRRSLRQSVGAQLRARVSSIRLPPAKKPARSAPASISQPTLMSDASRIERRFRALSESFPAGIAPGEMADPPLTAEKPGEITASASQ